MHTQSGASILAILLVVQDSLHRTPHLPDVWHTCPQGAHTAQLCLMPAQFKSEGRKMLTLCVICIFIASSFSSWQILSLSYQMPHRRAQ